jgi:SRSO17 transposase
VARRWVAGDNVRRMHQSLHHVVADAPWSDEAVLDRCLDFVIPAMLRRDPVVAWVVDDTGFPKKGRESVGVARQYCGQVGKQDNCRVAVSLSVTTEKASMPVAYRLYLPQSWIEDRKRRKKTGVPDWIQFQTKAEIALAQIRRARERGIPQGVVLADAGYGTDTGFRAELRKLDVTYVVGIQSATTIWKPGEEPKPAPARKGNTGRPRKLLQRDAKHQPVAVKELALGLPTEAWKKVTWRQGVKQKLQSRFAAMRVRPAHRDLLAVGTLSARMVADRMASRGIRTHQVLAIHPSGRHRSGRPCASGQTSLDHRTGLPGIEAGTRLRPLRRAWLARFSSSRHLMHCGLWIPGGRTESFFPLSPSRQSWITHPRTAAGLPAAWFAAFVPSGIIHARSLP